MLRPLQHVLGCSLLDKMPGVHDEDTIREIAGAGHVVGDVEERDAFALAQLAHQVQDPDADRDVEHRHGLVGDDQLRPQRQRLREADPLALAATQLVGEAAPRIARRNEAHLLEHAVQLGAATAPREIAPVQLHSAHDRVRDPVRRIDRAVRILEHHRHRGAVREPASPPAQAAERPALEPDLASRRPIDEREQPGDRALAAAALADERNDLAAADGQVDVVDRMQCLPRQQLADAEVAGQALGAEQRLGQRPFSRRTQRTRLPFTE